MTSRGNGQSSSSAAPHPDGGPAPSFDLPPQNAEAERGVLGGILLDNDHLPAVRAIVGADDFFGDAHQRLFRGACAVAERGEPVDAITLADELERRRDMEKVGGIEALRELVDATPHAANTIYYAEIVRQKAVARGLVEAADRVRAEAYSNRYEAAELAERARGFVAAAGARIEARGEGPVLVRLADVRPAPVRWFWPRRIPLGKPTLFIGDPAMGKSFLSLALAAVGSAGGRFCDLPDGRIEPCSVLLLSAEDSLGDTIRPRLDAAGADVDRVHALTTIRRRDGTLSPFDLTRDIPRLREALDRVGDVRLCIIDPVSAYLGSTDEFKNAEVRGLVAPLSALAERYDLALVLITHMNKGTGFKAIYRATGSLAFVAAARMAYLVIKDRSDPARRLVLPAKSNLVAEPTGLAYRIVDGAIRWEAAPVAITADQALAAEREEAHSQTKAQQAEDWLRIVFTPGTVLPSEAILHIGKAMGFRRPVLFAAKKALGIPARKSDVVDGAWEWLAPLPETEGRTLAHFEEQPEVIDE